MPDISLGAPSASGRTVRVLNLTRTTAFQIRCDGGRQSEIEVASVSKVTACPISGLVISAASPGHVAKNQEHTLNIPSIHFPADMMSLDLRVKSITVDDYSPKLFVRNQLIAHWAEGHQNAHTISNLNHPIGSAFTQGENSLKCQMMNRNRSGHNPVGCWFTLEGSYLTEGSCVQHQSSPVQGRVEKIEDKYLHGYACQMGSNASIAVHVYLDGAAGAGGSFLVDATANRNSGQHVKNFCKSGGTQHRFKIDLRPYIQAHAGKPIYVHGIEPGGAGNRNYLLTRSGVLRVPRR
jgi:hypothetical protein